MKCTATLNVCQSQGQHLLLLGVLGSRQSVIQVDIHPACEGCPFIWFVSCPQSTIPVLLEESAQVLSVPASTVSKEEPLHILVAAAHPPVLSHAFLWHSRLLTTY